MSKKVVNLGAARADASRDCRDWTPLDALREALDDIEGGVYDPDMIFIAMTVPRDDGTRDFYYKVAGGNRLEIRGLLHRHLTMIDDND